MTSAIGDLIDGGVEEANDMRAVSVNQHSLV